MRQVARSSCKLAIDGESWTALSSLQVEIGRILCRILFLVTFCQHPVAVYFVDANFVRFDCTLDWSRLAQASWDAVSEAGNLWKLVFRHW